MSDPIEQAEPVEFTDSVATEVPDPEQTDAPDDTKRGRPRDPKAVERDDAVLEALRNDGPVTRDALATKLGLEPNLTYLSLWRLKKNGQVEQGDKRVWQVAGTNDALAASAEAEAPVAETVEG